MNHSDSDKQSDKQYVAVLLDAHALLFHGAFIQRGSDGGQGCAIGLTKMALKIMCELEEGRLVAGQKTDISIFEEFRKAVEEENDAAKAGDMKVVAGIFATQGRLYSFATNNPKIRVDKENWKPFWDGFTGANPLLTLSDIGCERMDMVAKLAAHLELYGNDERCACVILGPSSARQLANILEKCPPESLRAPVVWLTPGNLNLGRTGYDLPIVECSALFRDQFQA